MIPLTTRPGAEITPVKDFDWQGHAIKRGAIYHLATWEPNECGCGNKTITVVEVDTVIRQGSIITAVGTCCPSLWDIPVKLPESLRKIEREPIDEDTFVRELEIMDG